MEDFLPRIVLSRVDDAELLLAALSEYATFVQVTQRPNISTLMVQRIDSLHRAITKELPNILENPEEVHNA